MKASGLLVFALRTATSTSRTPLPSTVTGSAATCGAINEAAQSQTEGKDRDMRVRLLDERWRGRRVNCNLSLTLTSMHLTDA